MTDSVLKNEVIYSTEEYSKFERMEGNRAITENGIRGKIASISKHGYIWDHPILVKKSERYPHQLLVVDGQHRFIACWRMGLPIVYKFVSDTGSDIDRLIELNAFQKSWDNEDFLNCYAERGIEAYIETKEFLIGYQCSINALLSANHRLRYFSNQSDSLRAEFKSGQMLVDSNGKKYTEEVFRDLNRVGIAVDTFNRIKFRPKIIVAFTWFSSSPKFELKRLVDGCLRSPSTVGHPTSHKEIDVRHLMEIYNYRLSEANKIRFVETKKGAWIEI